MKGFKKVLSVLLATVLLTVLLSQSLVGVVAQDAETQTEEEEYIYYSDLFYGYSYYLANAPYLTAYYTDTQGILDQIYDDYMDSPNFAWTNIKNSLAMATNLKEWAKMITDASGLTSFTYEKALDAANVDFATQLTGGSEIAKAYGTELKWVKKINDILKVYDTFDKNYDISVMTETEVFTAMFATIGDSGVLASINKTTLTTLQEDILPHISTITSRLSKGADILTAAKTIATGIMMEDFRMELIDEILSSTSSGTMLYDGMYRLKNQLRNGFVSYFLDQYLTDKVLNEIADKVVKKITGAVLGDQAGTYALIGAITKVASWIVFDCIFDVPDIDDLTKQMVLSEYAVNLHTLLKNKVAVFNTQFETEDIYDLEALATAYSAATNAALDASDKLKLSKNETRLKTVTEKYSNIIFYNEWIESAKSFVKSISAENRITTDFGTWVLTGDTTLSGASDVIHENYLYFPRFGLNADINKGHDSKFYGLNILDGQHIKLYGNFDVHFNDKYNVSNATLTIPQNTIFEVIGDFKFTCSSFSGSSGTSASLINYGELNVLGDAKIVGSYSYFFGGSQTAKSYNYGTFRVTGNITLDVIAGEFKNEGEIDCGGLLTLQGMGVLNNNNLIKTNDFYLSDSVDMPYSDFCFNMDKKDAVLIIFGNFKNDYGNSSFVNGWMLSQVSGKRRCNIVSGTVVFDGNQQQEMGGLSAANISVTNPCGIKYTSNNYLYGEYKLNGHPLDNNEYKTYIYDGCSFDQISDYKDLYVAQNMELSTSVKGNILAENYILTIPENAMVTIDGDVTSLITNNGNLTVTGNVTGRNIRNNGILNMEGDLKTTSSYSLYQTNEGTELRVGGNFSWYSTSYCNITAGKIVFDGTTRQEIHNLKAPTIIIENASEAGVVFTSSITPSVLFDHQGNNFTLHNNGSYSTFVDYDGDGLKDNVDPEPTVGNPCTLYFESEDTEKGTVSLSEVETIGGTKITVTATPTFKYDFSKWVNSTGTTVSASADWTLVATGDETYTAVFSKRQQPITTQADGGKITVVSKAEIESTVTVSITENTGYVYTEGSLAYNGIPVENGSFIMPDEPVILTATFRRNENYFLLKEKIEKAKTYTLSDYTESTATALANAITVANTALTNDVTALVAEEHMTALQTAIDALWLKGALLYTGASGKYTDFTFSAAGLSPYENGYVNAEGNTKWYNFPESETDIVNALESKFHFYYDREGAYYLQRDLFDNTDIEDVYGGNDNAATGYSRWSLLYDKWIQRVTEKTSGEIFRKIDSLVPLDNSGEEIEAKNFETTYDIRFESETQGAVILGFRQQTPGKFTTTWYGLEKKQGFIAIGRTGITIAAGGSIVAGNGNEQDMYNAWQTETFAESLPQQISVKVRVVGTTCDVWLYEYGTQNVLHNYSVQVPYEEVGTLAYAVSVCMHDIGNIRLTKLNDMGVPVDLDVSADDLTYENGAIKAVDVVESNGIYTYTLKIDADTGCELRAGSFYVVDENDNAYVPTRVGYRNGGDGNQYTVSVYGKATVYAEFFKPTVSEPNVGWVGVSIHEENRGLRYIHRVNATEKNGERYMTFGDETVKVKGYGLLIAAEPVLGDSELTVDLSKKNSYVKKYSAIQTGKYFDVCSDYIDIAVQITNIPQSAANLNIYTRVYMELESGEIVYGAVAKDNYANASGLG